MWNTAGDARKNSKERFFNGPLHMDVPVLTDQQKLIYNNSTDTGYSLKTCRERWIREDGERVSGKSVPAS